MCRLLARGNVRRFVHSFHLKQNNGNLEGFHPIRIPYSTYKYLAYYAVVQKGQTPFMLYKTKVKLFDERQCEEFVYPPLK